tara:strand:- start:17192 stop:18526 length:1335 start_codon:yes stop_codon:yes gene_type:complete
MDSQFLTHNSHQAGTVAFKANDPNLRRLGQQPLQYTAALIGELPRNMPGIYTLGGGRQVGKTTTLKQWMLALLESGVESARLAFLSGEIIDDHHHLMSILRNTIADMPTDCLLYIIVDEVTYIKNWDKAIKYLADAGELEQVVLMLSGSDLMLMQEAKMRFPGRRGQADKVDFHLYPLSFSEFVKLAEGNVTVDIDVLYARFYDYMKHGGYLTAINDYAKNQTISRATLMTYSDWIRGDMLKHGKQESYLKEILNGIIKHYTDQITWNSLAKELSIDHPTTVNGYVSILANMDAVFVQQALLEDKLVGAPKKARKIIFTDPFIFHAIRAWMKPCDNPFAEQIVPAVDDAVMSSKLVESIVVAHYRRYYPTYYIKAEGEVDVAYVKDEKFWPVEVKWRNQLRSKDLKQIAKYKNGLVLSKVKQTASYESLPTEPLPHYLSTFPTE